MNSKNHLFDKIAIEYDHWFDDHKHTYESELLAVKQSIAAGGNGLEVGVGTGRFAAALGIQKGIEPAANMAAIARKRGIEVIEGIAENLPYADGQFDFVLMVPVDCFVEDVEQTYREIHLTENCNLIKIHFGK